MRDFRLPNLSRHILEVLSITDASSNAGKRKNAMSSGPVHLLIQCTFDVFGRQEIEGA